MNKILSFLYNSKIKKKVYIRYKVLKSIIIPIKSALDNSVYKQGLDNVNTYQTLNDLKCKRMVVNESNE